MTGNLCFSTLGCVDYTPGQVISLAREHGISSVEIRGLGGVLDNRRNPLFAPDAIDAAAAEFASAGIGVACLGTSCAFHKPDGLAAALDEGTASAQIASRLGCPYIRVFGNKIASDLPRGAAVERVGKGIAALAGRISGSGVGVLLETHGDFTGIGTVGAVLEAASRDDVGLIWDVAHTERDTPGGWRDFLDSFFPLIKHVHFKDFVGGGALCLPGEGILPLREIAAALAERGYRGKISLEWEKKWHPELPSLESALPPFIQILL